MLPQKLYEKLLLAFSLLVLIACTGIAVADWFIKPAAPEYAEILASSEVPGKYLVNVNTADEDELRELPGIGETYAKRIVEFRQAHGDYTCIEDLTNVEGITEKLAEKLRELITF